MKIRQVAATIILTTFVMAGSLDAQDKKTSITARQVVERIQANVTCPWSQQTNDTFKALIILGHANSEEAGMKYCGTWLRRLVTEVPIKFIPAGDPFWKP